MKKALALITSAALALSMASSFAFVIGPSGSETSQMSIKSIKAVDIAVGVEGVRSYADIVDTSRIYQANEIINLATVLEVKNRAFEPTLATIKDKDIVLTVGSSTADLAYANYAPSVVSAVQTATVQDPRNILTFSQRIPTAALTYTQGVNAVDIKMKGFDVVTSGGGINLGYGISMNYLQDYKADIKDNKVMIPALNVGNYDMGTYTLQAPSAIEYTIIATGLTKDATSGDMEAKLRITGAEAFSTVGYVRTAGAPISKSAPFNKLSKLEIKNNYVVFKFDTVFMAANTDPAWGTEDTTLAIKTREERKQRSNTVQGAAGTFVAGDGAVVIDGATTPMEVKLTSGTSDNGNYRNPKTFLDVAEKRDLANVVAYAIFRYDANANGTPVLAESANADGVYSQVSDISNVGDFVFTLYTEESPNPGYISTKSLAMTSFVSGGTIITDWAKEALKNVRTLANDGRGNNATQIFSNSGVYNTSAMDLTGGAQGAMKAAASFFGIDSTLGWGGAVKNSHFEAKGAPATYSEAVTGTYNYGTISIIEEVVEENTDEVEEDLDEEDEGDIEEDEGDGDVIEDEGGEDEVEVVAPTGDFSSNMALALVASAIVAAAALAFVTKKAR